MKKNNIFEFVTIFVTCLLLLSTIYFLTFALKQQDDLRAEMEMERVLFDIYVQSKVNILDIVATFKENGIEGVAIWDRFGKVMFKYGDVPAFDNLPSPGRSDGSSYIKSNKNYIEYISKGRDTSIIAMSDDTRQNALNMLFGTRKVDVNKENEIFPIIYIKKKAPVFNTRRISIRILHISTLITIIFLASITYYYRKKNNTKREEQTKTNVNTTVGEAARTLAHEIKNPLSTILLQIALLKKLHRDQESEYDIIEKEANRILSLADKTTNFLSNPIGVPKRIELLPFIKDFYVRFDYPLLIAYDPKAEKAAVFFDEIRLISVIENLIKNAIDASMSENDYKEPILIEISLRGKNNIRILVEDRGCGLPKGSSTADLFNPFYTTKITGSGIGLAVCKQFVEAGGGTIQLYGRENKGTVAEIVLKRVE